VVPTRSLTRSIIEPQARLGFFLTVVRILFPRPSAIAVGRSRSRAGDPAEAGGRGATIVVCCSTVDEDRLQAAVGAGLT